MKTIAKIFFLSTLSIATLGLSGCASDDTGYGQYKNQSAEQLLAKGEAALNKNNFNEASKYFEALDALYPFERQTEQAQRDIIYSYYRDDQIEPAIAAADRYIQLYPRGEHTDYAYYMKGVINFDRGKNWLQKLLPRNVQQKDLTYLQQAYVNLSDLVKLFPDSKYAKDARIRMIYIRNTIAQHELDVANFYLERKAYVAAANRANYVIQHFQGAPQVIEALKVEVKAYRALGINEEAEQALKILHANYPKEKL